MHRAKVKKKPSLERETGSSSLGIPNYTRVTTDSNFTVYQMSDFDLPCSTIRKACDLLPLYYWRWWQWSHTWIEKHSAGHYQSWVGLPRAQTSALFKQFRIILVKSKSAFWLVYLIPIYVYASVNQAKYKEMKANSHYGTQWIKHLVLRCVGLNSSVYVVYFL